MQDRAECSRAARPCAQPGAPGIAMVFCSATTDGSTGVLASIPLPDMGVGLYCRGGAGLGAGGNDDSRTLLEERGGVKGCEEPINGCVENCSYC